MANPRLSNLFDEAVKLTPEQRDLFLMRLEKRDPAAYQALIPLLTADANVGDFLEAPLASDIFSSPHEKQFKPFRLNRYFVVEQLGRGGMATVYRALSKGAGGFVKRLAIKEILSHTASPEAEELFEHEACLGSHLNHPNIVHIYEFLKSESGYFLVMELVEGKNLAQILAQSRLKVPSDQLPFAFSVYVIGEVCKGLAYAHRKCENIMGAPFHIVHRDVSPQNVMISYEGSVKIVDFGIAKAKNRLDYTRTGQIRGKVAYLSPEQALGLPIDHRSDIFSTGLVLYELLVGEKVFEVEIDLATISQIQKCEIPNPRDRNPKMPESLARILLKALAKDRSERYQDIGEMQTALQGFLHDNFPGFGTTNAAQLMLDFFRDDIKKIKSKTQEDERVCSDVADANQPTIEAPMVVDPVTSSTPATNPRSVSGNTLKIEIDLRRVGAMVVIPCLIFLGLLYMDGRFDRRPNQIPKFPPRAQHEKMFTPQTLCTTEVNTSPPGASLLVEGKVVGITPYPIEGPCGRNIQVALKLEGYDTATQHVSMKETRAKMRVGLRKIGTGILQLTLNRDAKVFDGDTLLCEVKSQQQIRLSLRAREVHTLRFVPAGSDKTITHDFVVDVDSVVEREIDLGPPEPEIETSAP